MNYIRMILDFIRMHFFCNFNTSMITICGICAFVFFVKLMKDKGDKTNKTLEYLAGTAVFFSAFVYLY